MAKSFNQLLKEAKERESRRGMTHTRSSTQTENYEDVRRRFLPNLAQGATAGLVGAPVDLVNAAIGPFTGGTEPVMGSEWIGKKLGANTGDVAFTLGQFIDPHSMMKMAPLAAAGIIKGRGGNWLDGSVKKAMAKLQHSEFTPTAKTQGLNDWVGGPLSKYVKNRMATPDDEIRKLADQGILHVDPEQLNFRSEMYGKYPQEGQRFTANSDLARVWEGSSDTGISSNRAGRFPRGIDANEYDKKFLEQYPWIEKLDPEIPVYGVLDPPHFANDLGFDHLMDELSNAMDETSGFPQHLRLTPEGLQGLSVEEAVKKVDGINKFRAEKAKKANARFAAAEGIPVYKEYPEGYRWLEYKKPEPDVSKWRVGPKLLKDGKPYVGGESGEVYKTVYDENGNDLIKGTAYATGHQTQEEAALEAAKRNHGKEQLESWLKQEGDTMGHCVGGYCDDVTSGRSRILSLRDNEGKSVATVELSSKSPMTPQEWYHSPQVSPSILEHLDDFEGDWIDFVRNSPEYKDYVDRSRSWTINQIKGPGNKKPKPEAIPFIQDFVKSSGYKVEGDLHNTDMMKSGAEYLSINDVANNDGFIEYAINHGINPVTTDDDFNNLWRAHWNDYQRSLMDGGI